MKGCILKVYPFQQQTGLCVCVCVCVFVVVVVVVFRTKQDCFVNRDLYSLLLLSL